MKQLIKNITIQIYKVLTYLIPVNKKMIIFQSSNGRNYTGNPRYIYEEMVREGLDQEYESGFSLIQVQKFQVNARRYGIIISHIFGI